jgi:hypothetical protein
VSDDFVTQFDFFQVIPDFTPDSRNGGTCSISNLPMLREELGRRPEDVDGFVLRGPFIDFEGYFDVRPGAIIRTAEQLGMISGDEAYEQVRQIARLHDDLTDAQNEVLVLQGELAALKQLLSEALSGGQTIGSPDDVMNQTNIVYIDDDRFFEMYEEEHWS